ncbi:MAG: ankyrin repeat domain-containing protein, partial [Gammaproteobacteria bacterium]|nr:ankyrin repeat domain-containing protein [Gammaproteobacteria bacterium]
MSPEKLLTSNNKLSFIKNMIGIELIKPLTQYLKENTDFLNEAILLRNNDQQTLLHLAVIAKNTDLVTMLRERRTLINCVDINGKTALSIAIESQDFPLAKLLLEKNAVAEKCDDKARGDFFTSLSASESNTQKSIPFWNGIKSFFSHAKENLIPLESKKLELLNDTHPENLAQDFLSDLLEKNKFSEAEAFLNEHFCLEMLSDSIFPGHRLLSTALKNNALLFARNLISYSTVREGMVLTGQIILGLAISEKNMEAAY